MHKQLWMIVLMAAIAACTFGRMPMSRNEFRVEVSKDPKYIETYIANRQLGDVAQIIKQKTLECLNFRTTHTRQSGYMSSNMSFDYNSAFRVVNAKRAELTIQQIPRFARSGPEMPEGGFYVLAIDFEAQSAKTRLTFYGSAWGWESTFAAIKDWSEGRSAKCPVS